MKASFANGVRPEKKGSVIINIHNIQPTNPSRSSIQSTFGKFCKVDLYAFADTPAAIRGESFCLAVRCPRTCWKGSADKYARVLGARRWPCQQHPVRQRVARERCLALCVLSSGGNEYARVVEIGLLLNTGKAVKHKAARGEVREHLAYICACALNKSSLWM